MRILYIDNDPDDCYLFNEAVKDLAVEADVSCLTVRSGPEALEMLKNGMEPKPDLIFLDVNMPGMDGLQCLTEIRSDPQLKDLHVVMFSTSITDEYHRRFRQLNAKGLEKPISYRAFVTTIRNAIEEALATKDGGH